MNKELEKWKFGINNNELIDLVLKGKKTATTYIYHGNVDKLDSESIILYDNDKPACLVKTTKNIVTKFKDVEWSIAKLEGENDDLEGWRKNHYEFFKSIEDSFNEETLVVVEIFKLIKIY